MRLASRVVSTLLVALGVVTCSESPTNLRRGAATLSLVPRFSPAAQAIYRSLTAFAVTLDNVHIVVRGAPVGDALGAVLKDTVVAFPATAEQISIELELQITGSEETVVATVDLQSGSTIYFEGTQELVARVGDTITSGEPVAMSYVGPGAAATSMTIFPIIPSQPVTIAPLGSATFTVQAQDQLEHVVSGLPVTWKTLDPTIATVSSEGVVTATSKAGSTTLVATGLNGVSAQTTIDVAPVTQLVTISGDKQTGIVGSQLTANLTVQALAANGHFVTGATVNFAAANGLGTVSQSAAATDLTGLATTTLTLGQTIGTYTFTATVAGAPSATTRVTASATSGPPAALGIVDGNSQSDTVAATLVTPLRVKVTDSFGNPLVQQLVDFQVTSQNALLLAAAGTPASATVQVATGSTGVASVSVVGGTTAGTVRITASVPQTSIPAAVFTETLGPANPAQFLIIQQPSKAAQATIPLGTQPKLQVADQFGNAVPLGGLEVDAALTCTRCGLMSASRLAVPTTIARTQSISDTLTRGVVGKTAVTTDAAGVAVFSDLTLNVTTGPWQLEFFTPKETLAVAFSDPIDVSAGPPASIIAWGVVDTSFISFSGDSLFPSVRVIDKVGNGIAGVKVTWQAADKLSLFDGKNTVVDTQTDDNGISAPGTWVTPVGAAGPFFVDVISTGLALENSPLRLVALLQPLGVTSPAAQRTSPR